MGSKDKHIAEIYFDTEAREDRTETNAARKPAHVGKARRDRHSGTISGLNAGEMLKGLTQGRVTATESGPSRRCAAPRKCGDPASVPFSPY